MSRLKHPSVDVLIIGFGWTGALMARELAETGLNILALEREKIVIPGLILPIRVLPTS